MMLRRHCITPVLATPPATLPNFSSLPVPSTTKWCQTIMYAVLPHGHNLFQAPNVSVLGAECVVPGNRMCRFSSQHVAQPGAGTLFLRSE